MLHVAAVYGSRHPRPPRRPLRAALVGTLLAVVAVSGLSAYAPQGVCGARPTAPCQASTSCR